MRFLLGVVGIGCLLVLCVACGDDDEGSKSSAPGSQDLCERLDAVTVDDPEYVRGVCSAVGFNLAKSGLATCEEARDDCMARDLGYSCQPAGGEDSFSCPGLTPDDLVACWEAISARVKARYAAVRCEDPSSAVSVTDPVSPEPAPDACKPLERSCPELFAVVAVPTMANSMRAGGAGAGAPAPPEANDPDPLLCGGAYRSPCAADKFCSYTDGCGTVGHCRPRRMTCAQPAPVCGCDGATYESECAAAAQGIGLSREGPCAPVTNQFSCGGFRCERTGYCIDSSADRTDPDQQRFACPPLPDGCTTCACAEDLGRGCFRGARCTEQSGFVTVTCQ